MTDAEITKAMRHIERAKKLILSQPVEKTPILELVAGSHLVNAIDRLEERRSQGDAALLPRMAKLRSNDVRTAAGRGR